MLIMNNSTQININSSDLIARNTNGTLMYYIIPIYTKQTRKSKKDKQQKQTENREPSRSNK